MSKAVSPQPSTASYNSIDEIDFEEEPVDTGLIRCVCDSSEDDGFTIQCERCLVWQHAYCVKISQHNIPDHYLCDQCEHKLKKLVAAGDFRAQVAGFMRGMEINGIGVISKGKQRARPESAKRIDSEKNSLADDGDEEMELEENVKSPATGRPSQQYRKNPVGRPPSRKPKLSKRISMPKRSMQDIQSADSSLLRRRNASRPGRKRKQSSGEYQHTDSTHVRSEHAYQVFQDTIDRWKMIMNRRKELNGSKSGMEIPFLVAMNDGIPSPSPDISTRQLSPELQQGRSTKSDKSLRKGVFADTFIPANQFLTEVTGDIILKSEYKFDPRNDFVMLGTPRPHVFFYPTIDLCVDARTRGNEARFVRRSCHPNAELRGILLPNAAKDQTVHLGLFTRNDVQKGQEITIGWGWQRGHISWMKNLEWHNLGRAREGHHVVDEEDERSKRAATGDMLEFLHEEFGDCACKDSKACFIYYLDKEQESQAGFDRSIYSTPKTPVKRNWWKAEFGTSDNDQAEVGEEKQIKRQSVDAKSLQIKDSLVPASRQSIVSAAKEVNGNGPSDSADENVDIDIISTSPVVGSPVISAPTTMNDGDNEDDLDIDGDIDVGQENVETPGAAGQDAEGSTSKEIRSVAGNASKEAAKLPCKKNWMRTYLKQVENVGSVNQSVKQPSPSNETASSFLPLNEKEDVDVEMESENKPESSTKVDAVKSKNQGDQVEVNMTEPTSVKTEKPESNIAVAAATADKGALPGMNGPTALSTTLEAPSQAPMEEIDEGEMSDASSASTIPLDDQSYQETSVKAESASKVTANIDVDMDNAKAPEEAKMSEEVTTHHEATGNKRPDMSANDAEQSKPTKVKLSLQEYLSRRAAGQSLTNELAGEQQKTKEKEPSLNGPDSKLSETTA